MDLDPLVHLRKPLVCRRQSLGGGRISWLLKLTAWKRFDGELARQRAVEWMNPAGNFPQIRISCGRSIHTSSLQTDQYRLCHLRGRRSRQQMQDIGQMSENLST